MQYKLFRAWKFLQFYNPKEAVSEFLTVFKNNFRPNADLRQSRFKCSFTMINRQPTPRDGFPEVTDSRILKTNVYKGIYFNDFIKSNLDNNKSKRVIMNGMSGSRWKSTRFDRLCITVNSNELKSIGK